MRKLCIVHLVLGTLALLVFGLFLPVTTTIGAFLFQSFHIWAAYKLDEKYELMTKKKEKKEEPVDGEA